jgi:hypothetical protein
MGIGTLGGVFGLWLSGVTLDATGNYSVAFTLISGSGRACFDLCVVKDEAAH